MSSLDLDLDAQINNLEGEWRVAYDAGIVARAEYECLASGRSPGVDALRGARERLARAESKKSQIMAKIERLEERMLRKQTSLRKR